MVFNINISGNQKKGNICKKQETCRITTRYQNIKSYMLYYKLANIQNVEEKFMAPFNIVDFRLGQVRFVTITESIKFQKC